MIAEFYATEIRTICLTAVAACRLPVAGMAALARRAARPRVESPPAGSQEAELAELVRRLRAEFEYDPALDPDAEAV